MQVDLIYILNLPAPSIKLVRNSGRIPQTRLHSESEISAADHIRENAALLSARRSCNPNRHPPAPRNDARCLQPQYSRQRTRRHW